jgi:hypothetical protein
LRTCALVAAAALVLGGVLGGCGLATKVKKVTGALQANKATIDQFTSTLRSGQPAAFQATYATTGSSKSTITYAALPPNDLAIAAAGAGSSKLTAAYARYVQNRRGQFWCQRAAAGGWSCTKLHNTGAGGAQQLIAFYTPAHWATFLQAFSLAAGFSGDKITKSAMTVNGFPMQCVDFTATNVTGTSKICTTAQHLLGFEQVVGQPVGFELTKYSTTPDPALFRLPAGAKIS